MPGLYAAGEVAGFGGGGVHGYRALEGTFLGGCLFSGRAAGRAVALARCLVRVLEIRRDGTGDVAPIQAVHRAAFARDAGEPMEVGLVDALRADAGWLPHFSLVAVVDGQLVGHVVATRASVDGVSALGVGPLGVLPAFQAFALAPSPTGTFRYAAPFDGLG